MISFRSPEQGKKMHIGVAWYRPEQWQRLREISTDNDVVEETYAEWVRSAKKALRVMRRQGVYPVKIDVDVEELLRWCENQHIPVDGEARSSYVVAKLREMSNKTDDQGD